ncbi:MAG: hypothetical protein PW734_09100 [Verrucomicrobium sp.]|nr:hypothetical protein [Verrucomicrobium sp.]
MRHLFCLLVLAAFAAPLHAAPLSAFQAEAVASKQVPVGAQQRLVLVRGDRSTSNLTPDVWHFVFYDEMASQNGRLVTLTGNSVTGIQEGYFDLGNLRLAAYKLEEVIDPSTLKVDSDKALNILAQTNLLKPYTLSSVLYDLSRDQSLREPVWRLRIYVDNNGKEEYIGYARVSATDGRILEMQFKPFVNNTNKSKN